MKRRGDAVLRVSRVICHHNVRPNTSRNSSFSPATVCVLCICERIDQFFGSSSESHIPSAANISEVIYNARLINTSLDSYDRMDGTLSEITIQPIIDTITGLVESASLFWIYFSLIFTSFLLIEHLISVWVPFKGMHISLFSGLLKLANDEIGLMVAQGTKTKSFDRYPNKLIVCLDDFVIKLAHQSFVRTVTELLRASWNFQ
jgi:hypothetical protein